MLFKHFTFLSNCSILLSEGERQNPTEKERKIFKHQKGKTMTLKYVGNRAFDNRLAEFSYNENEEERFNRIVEQLEEEGYKVTSGIEGWAAIEVDDREEFEEVKKDFQRIRRETR